MVRLGSGIRERVLIVAADAPVELIEQVWDIVRRSADFELFADDNKVPPFQAFSEADNLADIHFQAAVANARLKRSSDFLSSVETAASATRAAHG